MKTLVYVVAITALTSLASVANADVPVPAPGASPRVDAIKKAGTLRVGVLANAPWLVENTTGQGEAWSDHRLQSRPSLRLPSTSTSGW